MSGVQWAKAVAFDYMIENDLFEYHCSTWNREPHCKNCVSLYNISGQITYRGETFVVRHTEGRSGRGGMDDGSPPYIYVTRIQ